MPVALELDDDREPDLRIPSCGVDSGCSAPSANLDPLSPAGPRSRWSRQGTSASTSARGAATLVRAWYRGRSCPTRRPECAAPGLAHAADQPDSSSPTDARTSLASAFEIGRLLALSQPSMVAALLRWRQSGYQVARRGAVWGGILEDLDLFGRELVVDRELALQLGRGLVAGITINPSDVIGPPKELFTPGRAMGLDGRAATPRGQGLRDRRVSIGPPPKSSASCGLEVPRQPLVDLTKVGGLRTVGGAIGAVREIGLEQQVAGSISEVILGRPGGDWAGSVPRSAADLRVSQCSRTARGARTGRMHSMRRWRVTRVLPTRR